MKNYLAARKAANDYAELAINLEKIGLYDEAHYGFEAAAELDLMDDELQNGWGGPLNGQMKRLNCFKKIIDTWKPQIIVETGTFRGISAQWFSENSNACVYTCEKNKRYFLQAQKKLSGHKNINAIYQDSILFLNTLANSDVKEKRCMFYLDAHWEKELPLREELKIIYDAFSNPIILIDDFRVPYDIGYGYDNYGPGKILSLEILENLVSYDQSIGFPKESSLEETGAKRGYVVLLPKSFPMQDAFCEFINIDTFQRFKEIEDNNEDQFNKLQIESLKANILNLEFHCAERMKQIKTLTELINDIQNV